MDVIRLLLLLAVRNLLAHRVKTFLVGLLLFVGTFLVVLGSSLTRSVEKTMEEAITGSVAGQLQVYSADAEDELSLFGQEFEPGDFGEIPDFAAVAASIGAVHNVRAVVPMAIVGTTVFGSNDIDRVLTDLRTGVTQRDQPLIDAMIGRARRIVDGMAADSGTWSAISDRSVAETQLAALARAQEDGFWADFGPSASRQEGLAALDWLDSNIAPLAADGGLNYLQVLGTDPQLYAESFDKFYIVDGQNIEAGQRGFLFSKRTYESLIKHVVARQLDDVLEALDDGSTLAGDDILALKVARNAKQYRRVVYQLTPERSDILRGQLATLLGDSESDVETLVQRFLAVDDSNARERHAWFYEHIAPHIQLYSIPVGSTITLRSYTKSGYMRAINVPVVGTYELQGLEQAGLMSASNLADLETFRSLYGKQTDADRAELAAIRADVQAVEVSRDDAEAMLFGGGADLVVAAEEPAEDAAPEVAIEINRQDSDARYDPALLRQGLAINAAILLDDPSRIDATRADIEAAIERDGLGLQVVDWQSAAGLTGQFILVMRLVMALALFLIFLVAMIIINNAMVMATMDRVAEIGTMRAIGAQRSSVVGLFLVETLALGAIAGGLGAVAAALVVLLLHQVGIPAPGDIGVLLFAGPRLYPMFDAVDLLFGLVVVSAVAFLSTLYPAVVASRTAPTVAMQGKD
ncbi:MAG: ABC-type lipoprotein release transport system permease subunit [Myxococcota bacterium]|jgi:ABC-type lipoprotein release transport system permease subunit